MLFNKCSVCRRPWRCKVISGKGGTIMQRREVVFTDCICLARATPLQTFVVSYIDTD